MQLPWRSSRSTIHTSHFRSAVPEDGPDMSVQNYSLSTSLRSVSVAPRFLCAASQLRTSLHSRSGLALHNTLTPRRKKIGVMLSSIESEARLGELLREMTTGKGYDGLPSSGGRKPTLPEGISWKQSHQFQALAENLDLVDRTGAGKT